MGISSTLKGLLNFGKNTVEFASHWHTVGALIETLFGKEPGEKASDKIKGLYGLFGMKDEKEFILLLDTLTPGEQKILIDYVDWQFPRRTPEEILVAVYYGNKFRTFVLTLGTDEHKMKLLKRITDAYEEARAAGLDEPLRFENIRYTLLRLHVPIPPNNAVEALERARAALPELIREWHARGVATLQAQVDATNARVDDLRRNRSFTHRIVKSMRLF